ncbi:FMRFamide receptor-like [Mytilus galloprovincialis]|uniref:FMRFamide receptor-like n=1 Tax=Mytilus galloprovincialis TaxID=29158 RepID=UPI003F7BCA2A
MNMDAISNISDNFSVPINTHEISFALEWTRFVADRILIPVIVILGIAGNSCNIAVLSRPKMRTSTNVYLTNLAVFDMLYLIFMLTLSMIHCRDKDMNASSYYYIPYGRALSDLFGNCSVWVTVCFTLERYIGVCHPMKGKAWCTVQKAKFITLVLFLVCLCNTLPIAFENEVITDKEIMQSINYKCDTSEFGQRESYQFGYYWWYITLFTFVPLILLSVFNMFLIKSVWHANKRRKLLSQSHVLGDHNNQCMEQQKVTTMLISVVIIFLLCQIPWAILLIYKVYVSAFIIPHDKDIILIAGNICNMLGQVNASINFILYSYFSSRFRRTFKKLLCRWQKKKRGTNIMISDYQSRKSDFTKDSVTTSLMAYRYRRDTVRETNPIWKAPHIVLS